jgi:hypothetical protein
MPPRIPVRFPWASTRCIGHAESSIALRSFTSTSPSLALGPESPNYVEVPKPAQPTFPLKPRIKGVLPIPRDVFKTRSEIPKASDEFIAASTPDPTKLKASAPFDRHADYRSYKQRMAESRRQALREGVKQLHERKTTTEAEHKAAVQALYTDKLQRTMAPPREADVLTQNSVSKSIRDFLVDALPSTSRSNVTDARRRAFERKMAKHAAVREDRLHDLYTNAREFIVSEEQLDEAIETAFGTDQNPVRWDAQGRETPLGIGKSPWEGRIPEGVAEKLNKLTGGAGVGLAKERIKKVAEDLTGGKM